MNYQKVILVGNATSNAQQRTSKTGDVTYTVFGLGIRCFWQDKSEPNGRIKSHHLRIKVDQTAAQNVTKGRQVLVEGRLTVSDKGRFSVIADRVEFGAKPVATEQSK